MSNYNLNNPLPGFQTANRGMEWEKQLDNKVSQVMKSVYLKMFLALLVTSAVSLGIVAIAPEVLMFVATHTWVYWVVCLGELGLVMAITGGLNRFSSTTISMLFYLFAIVNGLTFSIIFVAYSPVSILKTFLITAGTFGAMTIYGYFTTQNLARIGSLLVMALFGLIICTIVNIFWKNGTFDWIISGVGVLIFIGLTAWDTQQIKRMAESSPMATDGRLATVGALSLYLDFINLFLYLLRFFGNRD